MQIVLPGVNFFQPRIIQGKQLLLLNSARHQVRRPNGPVMVDKILVKIGGISRIALVKKDERDFFQSGQVTGALEGIDGLGKSPGLDSGHTAFFNQFDGDRVLDDRNLLRLEKYFPQSLSHVLRQDITFHYFRSHAFTDSGCNLLSLAASHQLSGSGHADELAQISGQLQRTPREQGYQKNRQVKKHPAERAHMVIPALHGT